jgi:aminoglycoside phosphotransferase (APT) family kinase protein
VFDGLRRDAGDPATIHRDFYDKQIFVGDGGRPGLLDLDTLAAGEAALDVGNMMAHLELRSLQGAWTPIGAARAAAALLEGYAPVPALRGRIDAYADATRLRLAALYAFRPRWRHLSGELVGLLG